MHTQPHRREQRKATHRWWKWLCMTHVSHSADCNTRNRWTYDDQMPRLIALFLPAVFLVVSCVAETETETQATSAPTPRITATARPTPQPTDEPTVAIATPEATTVPSASALLETLAVEPEYGGSGYERAEFEHDRGYLCDSAGTDPYTGVLFDPSVCDVDHIVAAKEAFDSGAWEWDVARRQAFGNDASNLVATRDCVNRSKGARDLGEWSGRVGSGDCEGVSLTGQGWCYLAWKSVEVKAAYGLSVDEREKDVLSFVLGGCPVDGPMLPAESFTLSQTGQTTPTASPPTEEPISNPTPTEPSDECHPAYTPCLPNLSGNALNCDDLAASQKPVRILESGVDPYRLDGDGDGSGCESGTTAATPTPRPTQRPSTTRTCTHDGRGHGNLGYNPGTHTHPNAGHGPHQSGKCAGV